MLDAAIETMTDGEERPIVHSARGAHYRWVGWLMRISEANLIRSMPRRTAHKITLLVRSSSAG